MTKSGGFKIYMFGGSLFLGWGRNKRKKKEGERKNVKIEPSNLFCRNDVYILKMYFLSFGSSISTMTIAKFRRIFTSEGMECIV